MGSFFKTFFASLLSLIVFSLLMLLVMVLFVGGLTKKVRPRIADKSVLVLDLRHHYKEQAQDNPFAMLTSGEDENIPGLYDVVRLLRRARGDTKIAGVYVVTRSGSNGFAAASELAKALEDFKSSGKFVFAHGNLLTQRDYAVASVADSIFVSPQGFVEWFGFSLELAFVKGTLEKLEIEPQIFYAGKFKSATEPFRGERMSEENRLQSTVWLNELYNNFLQKVSARRRIDTAALRRLAVEGSVLSADDAVAHRIIDGLKYDDEVREIIRSRLELQKDSRLEFISVATYKEAAKKIDFPGGNLALIFAEGTIVDGKGREGLIGSDEYRTLIRRARMDKNIKAIVFRINSGGGSSVASENIWRELSLAQKEKPVVVSFGDVAASGGYYIACAADSIFADPSTLTGSIGVFGIIPNMEKFFRNKLGVTFDGVKTGPLADVGTPSRAMTEREKQLVQQEIDRIYAQFRQRVAEGRKKDTAYVETIAQGRVWTGTRAREIGLIDRFGGLQEAIDCAARMGKISSVNLREMPERENILDKLFKKASPLDLRTVIREQAGEENYRLLEELRAIRELCNSPQTRLPFQFRIR
ncbi:MAG TPA: signal peptide peptidase SppA [Chitinophagaceae bacterium]|nr:signal peptide peptidase SppA [Chitinophagaceae bacterium]